MKLYEKRLRRILTVIVCVYILLIFIAFSTVKVPHSDAEVPTTSPTETIWGIVMSKNEATTPDENPPLDVTESPTEPVETEPQETIPKETLNLVPIEPVTPTEPATEPPTEPPIESEPLYFDVPLSEDLQDHIFELCEESGVEVDLVMAMIRAESTYNPNCIGDGGDSLGLLQIQPKWHQWRMDKLACPDLMDPYQNVTVAIDILTEFYETGKSDAWILMAYNGGEVYANRKASNGEISDYAVRVLGYRDELTRG